MGKFWVTIYLSKEVTQVSLEKANCCFGSVRPRCSRASRHRTNAMVTIEHFKLACSESHVSADRLRSGLVEFHPFSQVVYGFCWVHGFLWKGGKERSSCIDDNENNVLVLSDLDFGMVNEHKITKAVGPKAADSASGWSCVFLLAMLTLLADCFILVVDFLRKFKCRSAVTKTFGCHMVVLEMKLVEFSFILELVMDLA